MRDPARLVAIHCPFPNSQTQTRNEASEIQSGEAIRHRGEDRSALEQGRIQEVAEHSGPCAQAGAVLAWRMISGGKRWRLNDIGLIL